jgi:hypothetical protein
MFGLKKRGARSGRARMPTTARFWRPIPPSKSSGRRSRLGIGGRSASAGPRTSTRSPPTVVFGSTPMTRPPSATRASASTVTRAILLSSGPS